MKRRYAVRRTKVHRHNHVSLTHDEQTVTLFCGTHRLTDPSFRVLHVQRCGLSRCGGRMALDFVLAEGCSHRLILKLTKEHMVKVVGEKIHLGLTIIF